MNDTCNTSLVQSSLYHNFSSIFRVRSKGTLFFKVFFTIFQYLGHCAGVGSVVHAVLCDNPCDKASFVIIHHTKFPPQLAAHQIHLVFLERTWARAKTIWFYGSAYVYERRTNPENHNQVYLFTYLFRIYRWLLKK